MEMIELECTDTCGYTEARKLAIECARETVGPDPVLLAWHDCTEGMHSAPVKCTDDICKPSCEDYAMSNGGSLVISLDKGRYGFFFGPKESCLDC